MFIGTKRVAMVQFFPATNNYIVHFEGAGCEHFLSDAGICSNHINEFITDCLRNKCYHESTIHMPNSQVDGKKTIPMRQVIYCRSFSAEDVPNPVSGEMEFNWVLWVPTSHKLTINSGSLGASKDFIVASLKDAPDGVVDFMSACTDGRHVALSDHHCEPDYSGEEVCMKTIDEYFFSTGKVIYGFQHNQVRPITKEDTEAIGIEFYGA